MAKKGKGRERFEPSSTISMRCVVLPAFGLYYLAWLTFPHVVHGHFQSWVGKAKFALEGIVYEYELGSEAESYTKIKQVSEKSIKGWIEGTWRGKITWRTTKDNKDKSQVWNPAHV